MTSRTVKDKKRDLLDLLIDRPNWTEHLGTREVREFSREDGRMTASVWTGYHQIEFTFASKREE